MAKATPDVWNLVVAQAARPYVDPGLASNDDPEVDLLQETRALVSRFAQWCRMKHEPDARRHGYGGVFDALMALARDPANDATDAGVLSLLLNEDVDDDRGHDAAAANTP